MPTLSRSPLLTSLGIIPALAALAWVISYGIGITPDSISYIQYADTLRSFSWNAGFAPAQAPLLHHFPPLFPALLAILNSLGLTAISATFLLNLAAALALFLIVSKLTADQDFSPFLRMLTPVLLVFYAPVLSVYTRLGSEPLFLALAGMSLVCFTRYRSNLALGDLAMASLWVGLSCLTRYAGGSLVLTGILLVVFMTREPVMTKAKNSLLFMAIAIAPVAAWSWSLPPSSQRLAGCTFIFHPVSMAQITAGLGAVGSWFLWPAWGAPLTQAAAFLVIAIGFLIAKRSAEDTQRASPLIQLLALFGAGYLAFLLASVSFLPEVPLNTRMFSPLLFPVYVLLLLGIQRLWNMGGLYRPAAGLCVIYLLVIGLVRSPLVSRSAWEKQLGFGSAAWAKSALVQEVKKLPPDSYLISNAPDAVIFLTSRNALSLPGRYDTASREPVPNFNAALAELAGSLTRPDAYLVYFRRVTWRWYLPDEALLVKELNLSPAFESPEGAVYRR
jgi:hypothetical protein